MTEKPQPGHLPSEAKPEGPVEPGLKLYRLTPVARDDDPSWSLAPNHGDVVVRARSPADARLVAAEAELDAPDLGIKPSHGVSTEFASAFRNERLYTVIEEPHLESSARGGRGLVSGMSARTK